MKTIAFALVMMLAGVIATPISQVQNAGVKDQRVWDEIINGIIDSIKEQIKELGLDPYVVEYANGEYTFPIVGGVFSAQAYVKDFKFEGLSNILNNGISFTDNTIAFNVELPSLEASLGDGVADVWFFNRNLKGELRGRLAIRGLRLAGEVNLNGFDLILDLGLDAIESELEIIVFGRDMSDFINKFLGQSLPSALKEYREQLNRQIAIWIKALFDRLF